MTTVYPGCCAFHTSGGQKEFACSSESRRRASGCEATGSEILAMEYTTASVWVFGYWVKVHKVSFRCLMKRNADRSFEIERARDTLRVRSL